MTRASKRHLSAVSVAAVRSGVAHSSLTANTKRICPLKSKTPHISSSECKAINTSKSRFWLFKSEPETRIENGVDMKFSIDDLAGEKNQTTHWDGVRNHQAKNFMRDDMRCGELGLMYHSNCKPPGVVGIVKVVRESYPDHTAFDENDPHFDPKSNPDKPKWFMVDIQLVRKLDRKISLPELKCLGSPGQILHGMPLLTSSRLSVQPVLEKYWHAILALEKQP